MKSYTMCWLAIAGMGAMSFISCKEATKSDEQREMSLDELGQKIKNEQKGEMVMPESRLIAKMEYFEESEYLIIHFQRDTQKSYLYKNVPVEVWQGLKSADSQGAYFREKIRDVERYQMIR